MKHMIYNCYAYQCAHVYIYILSIIVLEIDDLNENQKK